MADTGVLLAEVWTVDYVCMCSRIVCMIVGVGSGDEVCSSGSLHLLLTLSHSLLCTNTAEALLLVHMGEG